MSAPMLLLSIALMLVTLGVTLYLEPMWKLGDWRWLVVAAAGIFVFAMALVLEYMRKRDERILQHANRIRQKRQAEAMRRLIKSPVGRFIDRDTFDQPHGGIITANIVRPRLSICERIGRWLRRRIVVDLGNLQIRNRRLTSIRVTLWLAQKLGMKVKAT